MRSQLTRSVFRRLLSNEPLIFRCPTRSSLRPHPRYASPSILQTSSRRSLFGFSSKQAREPKDAELAPGLSKMLDLSSRERIQARAPPAAELLKAWNEFFAYKTEKKEAVNNIQAQHALRTFKHLQMVNVEENCFGFALNDLISAMAVLKEIPKDKTDTHKELATLLFEVLQKRTDDPVLNQMSVKNFVAVLTSTGDSTQARDIAANFWEITSNPQGLGNSKLRKTRRGLWLMVMKGYAKENNELELLKTAEMAEAAGAPYGLQAQEIMTTFYASRNDVPNTKKWYRKTVAATAIPTPETLGAVLHFSIRNNELEWCKDTFRELLDSNPTKTTWDIIFQWAAGAAGKGVEDVERMMEAMIRHNPKDQTMRPDVDTINGLVSLAMSLDDPYLAERYIALGKKSGIRPNAQTFILQLEYRISAGDITGAQAAYEALQSEEILDGSDLPAINKYIRALCAAKTNHYDRIVDIVSGLDERHAKLEADTVSALCMMYLSRGELHEVVDTLQTQTFHYTLSERESIRNAFLAYCLDRRNSTSAVWDAYTIFRQIFDETPIEIRTQMMNEFFERKRSDMACHTFGHMRQHPFKDRRPVLETYIQCLRGIAKNADKESLDIVHNMLKMDSSIEPNTKLYNSLIMAYTSVGESDRALDFWDDITISREGPSYESLELVFKACEGKPFGDHTAREIWSKMRRMEIEVTREVFVAYVAALGGQGKLEEAQGLVESGERELGLKADTLTIGTIYNAIPGQNRKDLFETWAKDLYPDTWTELEKLGQKTMKEGHRMFNMQKLER